MCDINTGTIQSPINTYTHEYISLEWVFEDDLQEEQKKRPQPPGRRGDGFRSMIKTRKNNHAIISKVLVGNSSVHDWVF